MEVEQKAGLTPPFEARMFPVIHYVTYVGIVAHAAFIGFFLWLHVPSLAAFNVGSVGVWVGARVANRRLRRRLAAGLIFTEVLAHAVLAVSLLGWDSGFHYYLVPLIPFVLFDDDLPTPLVILVSALLAAVYLSLRVWAPVATMPLPAWLQVSNIFVPLLALGIISVYFRAASLEAERRMAELAMTDTLTGLPNRRHLRALLEQEAVRFKRTGRAFSVILGDIDDFKGINDSQGHDGGDRVLRELARLLRSSLRGQDQVARWGGEEFLFLLPETDQKGAEIVAEKLRAGVERAVLSCSPPVSATMTFGVSQAQADAPLEDCLRGADRALYRGKADGKNRVVVDRVQGAQQLTG